MENRLKEIRIKKAMSQRQFCYLLGINSQSQYARIENGTNISLKKALEIAKILEMRVEDIWKVKG